MATTIQEFAESRKFFTSRQDARDYAKTHQGHVEDLGTMGRGSYGLQPAREKDTTMRVWAVRLEEVSRE